MPRLYVEVAAISRWGNAMKLEPVTAAYYVLTPADVEDGRNRLGMNVSHLPFGVPLCSFCDDAIPPSGVCRKCAVIHMDIMVGLTEVHSDPLLKRKDAA